VDLAQRRQGISSTRALRGARCHAGRQALTTLGLMDVSVVQLDGTRHQLRLGLHALVVDVKQKLEAECGIPRESQRLLRGDSVLHDREALDPVESCDAAMELQLVRVHAPVLCVLGGLAVSALAERFEPSTGAWHPLPPLRSGRAQTTAVAYEGALYVLGGTDGARPLALVSRLSLVGSAAWEPMPPLRHARERCSAVVMRGALHAIGGASELQPLASVERLDACAGAAWSAMWEEGPPLSVARRDCSTAELGGAVYVVAGAVGPGARTAERLAAGAEAWERVADMMEARTRCLLLAADGMLYAVGGSDSYRCLASVERFRPEQGVWERLMDMWEARLGAAAVAYEGTIYVAGGSTGYKSLDSAERYDPALNCWQAMPAMSEARFGCAAAALGGHFYVLGGTKGTGGASAHAERYDLERHMARLRSRAPQTGGEAEQRLAWEVLAPLGEVKFACSAVVV